MNMRRSGLLVICAAFAACWMGVWMAGWVDDGLTVAGAHLAAIWVMLFIDAEEDT